MHESKMNETFASILFQVEGAGKEGERDASHTFGACAFSFIFSFSMREMNGWLQ